MAAPFHADVSILNVQTVHQLNIVDDDQILRDITKHFPENQFSLSTIKEDDVVEGLCKFVEDNNMDVLAISIHKRFFWKVYFTVALVSNWSFIL
jgi:hypothetical protein